MNDYQDNSPLLSLFDVLVDEYEHQVKTHGLMPLYTDDTEKTNNIDARLKQAKEMRKQIEKKRDEVKAKYALLADEKERERRINEELVKDFYRRLHQSGEKRAALCFSGGGVRSATFGLGVLQGLASRLDLGSFHYLSTVSGGGYLGSWLSAWAHRRGISEVQRGLEEKHVDKSPFCAEPEPIIHLRRYSNYMSPRLGLLSADTWTLVAIYLRNLFLNWLVLIPLMAAALSLPRLWMSALVWNKPTWHWVNSVFWFGFLSGVISIAYIVISRPSLADLTWRQGFLRLNQKYRSEDWVLRLGVGCLVITAIASALYWSWIHNSVESPLRLSISGFEPQKYFDQQKPWGFVAFGVALHFLGVALSQPIAPQIIKWKRYFMGIHDFIYGAMTGALGGLCLWMIARALPTPALIHPGQQITSQILLNAALYACFAPPLFLLAFLVAATVFMGLTSYYTSDADREWLARAGGWILIAIAVWTVVNSLANFSLFGLIWLWGEFRTWLVSTGIGSGIIALLSGCVSAISAKIREDEKTKISGLPVKLLELAFPFAAVIFVAALFAALIGWIYKVMAQGELATTYSSWQRHLHVLYQTPLRSAFFILMVFLVIGVVMGLFVNVNKFSLHSAYRDRLTRVYLGASRSANDRGPNPFTGMDEQDDLQMHDLIRPVFGHESFVDIDMLVARIVKREPPYGEFIWLSLSQHAQELLRRHNDYKDYWIRTETLQALTDNFTGSFMAHRFIKTTPSKKL